MKIIRAGYEIMTPISRDIILKHLERCGRVCYKSEDKITEESASRFVKSLIKNGHEAMIEHFSITVKFICDRGVSHEIVRHRIASYAQESTRYCNYSKEGFGGEITVIAPLFLQERTKGWNIWKESCEAAEKAYFDLLDWGCSPEQARAVLPNSLKTEIIVTMNLREWRHFFKLRAIGTTGNPHPQMREIALPLLRDMKQILPEVFGDLEE
jgi:thymidylate synthase (FAD)